MKRSVLKTKVITKHKHVLLDTIQLICKNGYPAETHTVLIDNNLKHLFVTILLVYYIGFLVPLVGGHFSSTRASG